MRFDVLGIGNAIVDIVATTSETFLDQHALAKGSMRLVDDATSERLTRAIGRGAQGSGGSAANTIAGLASLGGRGAFIGKTGDDALGRVFRDEIRKLGVHFATEPLRDGTATARCLVLVTPDAQRTMATFLGASSVLAPADIDEPTVAAAAITYLEGYLFDPPLAMAAFRRAVELAHGAKRHVALTLSDPFCVERHRAEFLALIEMGIDVLFANEAEVASLLGTTDLAAIRDRLAQHCAITVVTRSERGSAILTASEAIEVAARLVGPVVDTTGAGDLYAAGFLYGLSKSMPLAQCGALGSLCAGEAISHLGARPRTSLAALAAEHGLRPSPSAPGVA